MNTLAPTHPLSSGTTASSRLIGAYQGFRQPVTPVWFMRQAGRSLPEYRDLRVGTRMLDACLDPELASEITLQPVRRHGVDAAIFFSDIVIPLRLAGVDVDIVPGKGPVLSAPVRTAADVDRLTAVDPASLDATVFAPIIEAVRRTTAELATLGAGDTPLIGFAGAPFTLAAYLVEGGPSKDHIRARTMMHADPEAWARLMDVDRRRHRSLPAHPGAGGRERGSAVRLVGRCPVARRLCDPCGSRIRPRPVARARPHLRGARRPTSSRRAKPSCPLRATCRSSISASGPANCSRRCTRSAPTSSGVDYRVPLDEASRRLGHVVPVQGNVDPALLDAPWPVLEAHVRDVLARGASAPSHVLNLGHGVPPETDPTVLTRLVEFVHGL